MIPLAVCSVLVLAIVIEKFIGMGAMERKANKFIEKAQGILKSNEERNPARILQAGIRKINKGREEIKEAVIDAGSLETPYLGRYLRILGTVVTISPLLGLLGTVRGMIRAFNVVALQGVGEPGALAAGISEALYTTAFGLGIAIPALVFFNYFTHRTDRLRKLVW